MGMPVTTPMAKLMAKMRAQKRAARFQRSSPLFKAAVFMTKRRSARPMVSCGKR